MSRMTLNACNSQEELKKRRLDEIISALCRLATNREKEELKTMVDPGIISRH
jgi:hypothetical protein